MELNYLKEFVVLADAENYTRAAEMLFISQSALSKHIKGMEAELGVPLFDRSTRKIRLTQQGRTLLVYARQIAQLQYQYETALLNQAEGALHTISIGTIPVIAPYHITDFIMQFQNENRNFSVQLTEADSDQLLPMLRENQCELAFVRDQGEPAEEFNRIPFTTDHLVAVLPATHRYRDRDSLQLDELESENFLLLPEGSMLHRLCIAECNKYGFYPRVTYTSKRARNILELVKRGMGVALLMKKPLADFPLDKLAVVDIEPKITTNIQIYHRKDRPLSAAAQHFIHSIQAAKQP